MSREIHDRSQPWGNTFIGWELRVDHGGELKRSELFRDRQLLEAKSEEWRDMLLEGIAGQAGGQSAANGFRDVRCPN